MLRSSALCRSSLVVFAAVLLMTATYCSAASPILKLNSLKLAQTPMVEMRNLTQQARLQLVGTSQLIRGFFSNKSVPLVIDDINRMNVREPLPPGSYMLLGGALPPTLRHGDQLELQGVIDRPTATDPAHLRPEQTILRLAAAMPVKVLAPSILKLGATITPVMLQHLVAGSAKFKFKLPVGVAKLPTHYAVLINGGINAANNWVSFYNDLVVDYRMLQGRGYLPANITVINANGGGAPAGACGVIPVNYAATSANVTTVFTQLAAKMMAQDTLCVMVTDHGGTGTICLWGQNMSAATFGALVNGIHNYSQMTFSFDLCHAAGIIPFVRGAKRIVFAACDADKSAYDSSLGHFGALNYAVVAALTGIRPTGGAVNADANGNGWVSLAETFNYVRSNINSGGSQTPHYEDNASPPDATGALPQGGNGVLGASTSL